MKSSPPFPRPPGLLADGFALMRFVLALLAVATGIAGVAGTTAAAQSPLDRRYSQPVHTLLVRMDQFLHSREVGGVTRDPRSLGHPAEEIRLTVVPQLLGYAELYRTYRSPTHYQDIVDRADYLVDHIAEASSESASDGMLGCALLAAWEVTRDSRYRAAAQPIIDRGLVFTPAQTRLNWGLMSAMALAEYARLTGDPLASFRARQIVWGVLGEQEADGSFPHYCPGTRDVHYTAWMCMEMILIGRSVSDPALDAALARADAFLRGRLDPQGVTRYEDEPGSAMVQAYYSLGSGCGIDYDTRGWTNELGYLALLFAERGGAQIAQVLTRLESLEDRGAYPDKWGYFPDPRDPIYPWSSSPRSVIRTSVIFWSLASLYGGPAPAIPVASQPTVETAPATTIVLQSASSADLASMAPASMGLDDAPALEGITPNPTSGACWIGFRAPRSGPVHVDIFDAAGRRVRGLDGTAGTAGLERLHWDGRDQSGARVGRGLYFVHVAGAGGSTALRVVVTD